MLPRLVVRSECATLVAVTFSEGGVFKIVIEGSFLDVDVGGFRLNHTFILKSEYSSKRQLTVVKAYLERETRLHMNSSTLQKTLRFILNAVLSAGQGPVTAAVISATARTAVVEGCSARSKIALSQPLVDSVAKNLT